MTTARPSRPPRLFASLIGSIGAAIGAGGAWLFWLGGSPYYLVGGLAVFLAGIWLWRGSVRGIWLYALFLAVTIIWSLWEAGPDAWALAPRLAGPSLIGLCFFFPSLRRLAAPGRSALVAGTAGLTGLLLLGATALRPDPEAAAASGLSIAASGTAGDEWTAYGGDAGGSRFSALSQINTSNVGKLEPAWTYRTGVVQKGTQSPLQATPIMVDGSLFLCTQTNVVIALDPETGREKWRFDPKVDPAGASLVTTCRGVAFARVAGAADCPARIVTATFDARLIALDARTGRPCPSFGKGGTVDLRQGLGKVTPGFYYVSSAPVVSRGRIVLGGWIADNVSVGEPSGVIRAFDLATGSFAWAWDLGRPGEHGPPAEGETFTPGTPNSWAPMSADETLGLVYVPTGNATPDHWGGHRDELMDRYSSSVVALDAATGEPRWSFQTVHHDVWDYDVGSQPTLVDVRIGGENVPALVQPTKQGQIYLLDRRNGRLLSKVEERAVRSDPAPGDRLSPTQPFSVGLPDFAGPPLRERDMWGVTPFDQLWCRIRYRSLRYDGPYTPVSTRRSLTYPGIGGGMNWGGVSVDPERGIMLVNSMRVATEMQLIPRAEADRRAKEKVKFHDLAAPLPQGGTPFAVSLGTFVSPLGVPCNEPPYGLVSAVDLTTRKLLWQRPLGTARDSGPLGISMGLPLRIGTPNLGGSVVTRGRLAFIAATQERAIRAYDVDTGSLLWSARLPAGGQATPMTYMSPKSGKQFVVVIAGGSNLIQSPLADYVQAFALPGPVAR